MSDPLYPCGATETARRYFFTQPSYWGVPCQYLHNSRLPAHHVNIGTIHAYPYTMLISAQLTLTRTSVDEDDDDEGRGKRKHR